MNKDEFEGKWHQIRGAVKAKWGQLTDDELDEVEGNFEILIGKIQEKYGQSRGEIELQLDLLVKELAT